MNSVRCVIIHILLFNVSFSVVIHNRKLSLIKSDFLLLCTAKRNREETEYTVNYFVVVALVFVGDVSRNFFPKSRNVLNESICVCILFNKN